MRIDPITPLFALQELAGFTENGAHISSSGESALFVSVFGLGEFKYTDDDQKPPNFTDEMQVIHLLLKATLALREEAIASKDRPKVTGLTRLMARLDHTLTEARST